MNQIYKTKEFFDRLEEQARKKPVGRVEDIVVDRCPSCSCGEKRQFDNAIETIASNFKDRTVILCENMTAGPYVFQMPLLTRFTGKYQVTPRRCPPCLTSVEKLLLFSTMTDLGYFCAMPDTSVNRIETAVAGFSMQNSGYTLFSNREFWQYVP